MLQCEKRPSRIEPWWPLFCRLKCLYQQEAVFRLRSSGLWALLARDFGFHFVLVIRSVRFF